MKQKQKDILFYGSMMVAALIVSFYVSPLWGGAVLFWIGIAAAVFYAFAMFGAAYGHKLKK
ncbi:MAG: hypothetical protein R6U91_08095 [Bacillota bacterium]